MESIVYMAKYMGLAKSNAKEFLFVGMLVVVSVGSHAYRVKGKDAQYNFVCTKNADPNVTTIVNLDAKRNVGRDANTSGSVPKNVDIPNYVVEEQEPTTCVTSLVVNCWTVGMHVLDTAAKYALPSVRHVIHLNSIAQRIDMYNFLADIILATQK